MAKDRTEFELSDRRIKASLPADQASSIGTRLSDLISPFVEGAGLLGDHIRIHRQGAALKGLKRVWDFAKSNNIPLRPVPPKFLVPWLEGVSLESPSDKQLGEMWAQLLLSATINPDSAGFIFIDILKKLRAQDAAALDRMWTALPIKSLPALAFYRDLVLEGDGTKLLVKSLPSLIKLGAKPHRENSPLERKFNKLRNTLIEEFSMLIEKHGLEPRVITVGHGRSSLIHNTAGARTGHAKQDDASVIPTLAALGLVEEAEHAYSFDQPELEGGAFKVRYYGLSPFGFEFMRACHPTEPPAQSDTP